MTASQKQEKLLKTIAHYAGVEVYALNLDKTFKKNGLDWEDLQEITYLSQLNLGLSLKLSIGMKIQTVLDSIKE